MIVHDIASKVLKANEDADILCGKNTYLMDK